MNPETECCPNEACPDYGQPAQGNIGVHSLKDQRFRCKTCGKTFSITHDTAFYRLKKSHEVFTLVVTLLVYGCPVQAIVAAFGLDARTVTAWFQRAGEQSQNVHEHIVGQSQLDLGQVQADEIRVKTQQGIVWMAWYTRRSCQIIVDQALNLDKRAPCGKLRAFWHFLGIKVSNPNARPPGQS